MFFYQGEYFLNLSKVYNLNLGSPAIPLLKVYILNLGSPAAPLSKVYVLNLGSPAAPLLKVFNLNLGSCPFIKGAYCSILFNSAGCVMRDADEH